MMLHLCQIRCIAGRVIRASDVSDSAMSLSSSVRARSESSSATLTACIGHVAACRICCGYTDGFSTGPWQLRVAAAASDDSSDDVAGLELGLTFLQGHREMPNCRHACWSVEMQIPSDSAASAWRKLNFVLRDIASNTFESGHKLAVMTQ